MQCQTDINALTCVGQNDIVSLRIICSLVKNNKYNIEQVDSAGNTALLKACFLGRIECARILLSFDANINAMNYFGQNALTLATYAGHLELVQELLCHRSYADFNLSSLTPAVCIAKMRNHHNLLQYFTNIDPIYARDVETVHGLTMQDIRDMVKNAELNSPRETLLGTKSRRHRYR